MATDATRPAPSGLQQGPSDLTTILTQARSALESTARRTVDLVRSLPDLDVPLPPPSVWTVREAAIHMVTYNDVYVEIAKGTPSPLALQARAPLAIENDRRIAEVSETDPGRVADLLAQGTARLLEATAGRSGDETVIFHENNAMDLAGMVCICLGEQLLHGYDIATAVEFPWPIDPVHAQLVLYGYGPLYPKVLNPVTTQGLTAGYGIELRGGSSVTARFAEGRLGLEPAVSGSVDCTITADPVAYLLVASGRLSQWPAIALGLIGAGGPRPELALGFVDLFEYP
jgi:uncharacterized protein (TIGR03083 family)